MRILVLIFALAFAVNDDGAKKGRKGNEMYRNAEHQKATALFSAGIEEQNSSDAGEVHSGLWNNLGASLHKMGKFDEARQAFGNAVALAPSNAEVARSSYNAGNNAFMAHQQSGQQQMPMQPGMQPPGGQPGMQPGAPQGGAPQQQGEGLQGALEHYKRAMLADPNNEDAKFNYEFVKRQLDEQEQNQDQQSQDQENQDQQNQDQQNQDQQNQDQQNQDQQNQDQQNQDQQNQDQQNQDQQEQNQQQQDQQQQQQPPPDPNKLSKQEAERILQALQNEEEELLRQVMKSQTRPKKVEKDW